MSKEVMAKEAQRKSDVMRNKLKFALYLDQTMSHYEGFYREDIKDAEMEVERAKNIQGNRKLRSDAVKLAKGHLGKLKSSIKNFKNTNYKLHDLIKANMQEESTDRLEGIADLIDQIVDNLFDPEVNLEISVLLTMYNEGLLDEAIEAGKKELEKK